jgi:hypothetical protein
VRLAISAKGNGFGSASKAMAIARGLAGHELIFLGDGTAVLYVRSNHDGPFACVVDTDVAGTTSVLATLARCDAAVVVMNEDVALSCHAVGTPYWFVDSLFGFWRLDRPLEHLAGSEPAELSCHERKLLAHLLAHRSVVQRHPGMEHRLSELRAVGADHVTVVGSVIDSPDLVAAPQASLPCRDEDDWTVVFNLGGYKNFVLDYGTNDAFVRLMVRVAWRLLQATDCSEVLVCCGAFGEGRSRTLHFQGRKVDLALLPHSAFVRRVRSCTVYAMTPGLTSLHESVALERFPLLLPEEHYGHQWNVDMLGSAASARMAVRIGEVVDTFVPDDDYEGTVAIAGMAATILGSERLTTRLAEIVIERVLTVRGLASDVQRAGITELRRMFVGPDSVDLIARQLHCFDQHARTIEHRGAERSIEQAVTTIRP